MAELAERWTLGFSGSGKLNPEDVHKVIDYDPNTGKMYWRNRPSSWFSNNKKKNRVEAQRRWDKDRAGREIIGKIARNGTLMINILGRSYNSTELACAHKLKRWPTALRYANRKKYDNRWINIAFKGM